MALLTTEEAVALMFKHLLGFEESKVGKYYFNEDMIDERVWTQRSLIPETAPNLADGETSGVVRRHIGLQLTPVPGSPNAYYHEFLTNAINFKYGDKTSYDWVLTYNDGTTIQKGEFRWLKTPRSKILYFYGGAPATNMPPRMSFYEYVGTFDEFNGETSGSNADDKYRGLHDPSGGELPTNGSGEGGAIKKGDFWRMSSNGSITGLVPEESLHIGDLLYADSDGAATSSAFFGVSRNVAIEDYLLASSTLLPQNQDQADALHYSENPSQTNPLVTLSRLNSAVAALGQLVGNHDASGGNLPTTGSGDGGAIVKGDYWRVTTAGTIPGLSPVEELENGDVIHAAVDNASDASEFFAVQANLNWDEKADIGDARFPSTDEKAAMTAASAPSSTNPFVTQADLNSGTATNGTYAGVHDASSGDLPDPTNGSGVGGAILKGDYWRVSVAGTITNLTPFEDLAVGDLIYATVNGANAVAQFFAVKSVDTGSTQEDITVTVQQGGYNPGDLIPAGTAHDEIFATSLAPYQPPAFTGLSVALTPSASNYEVGETVTVGNATISVTPDSDGGNPANMYISGVGFNKAAPGLIVAPDAGSEVQLLTNSSSQWQVTGEDANADPINPASFSRSWLFRHFFGASSVVLTGASTPAEVKAVLDTLQQQVLRTGRAASVTCGSYNDVAGNYTYIAYAAKFGDLSNIIQNGALPVLGAFTKIGEISYTNQFGVAEDYTIYISNADKAFASGTSLVIT